MDERKLALLDCLSAGMNDYLDLTSLPVTEAAARSPRLAALLARVRQARTEVWRSRAALEQHRKEHH